MATVVTKYRANDGSEWSSMNEALGRDSECALVDRIMAPIASNVSIPHGKYVQRDKSVLFEVRRQLWQLILERYGASYPHWKEWDVDEIHPQCVVGRIVCDSCDNPLSRAWARLAVFDFKNGREYDQPYYAANPQESSGEFIPAVSK